MILKKKREAKRFQGLGRSTEKTLKVKNILNRNKENSLNNVRHYAQLEPEKNMVSKNNFSKFSL
jgi:hypothetical protein